ncbi:response regulator [Rufibacter ruber]|uniref:response regulator n=1 Tax=Rufibacter ruber TaxID=1783499 RepID=UPI0008368C8A|nr:response regulator [Rufibacter ruber]
MERLNCVLLVDDDNSANFISKNVIDKLDCADQVLVAHNGREALHMIAERCVTQPADDCPQLIFLDVKMPVMDGFEFLREFEGMNLQANSRPIIIMLTTSTNPVDVQLAQQFKIAEFLNKPLKREKLAQLLDKYFKFDASSSLQAVT